ncbi:MAG: L,D-transpeptidase [Bosea sp. (in: a-proteobacteria)]
MRKAPLALLALTLALAGCNYRGIGTPDLSSRDAEYMALVPNFEHHITQLPWDMPYESQEKPGTIIVDTKERFLYFIKGENRAIRYAVAVGGEAFGWTGTASVQRKAEWPRWTPPPEMLRRWPHLAPRAGGMEGGPENPLGARALYLYQGSRDTLYRIHGTNEPETIGRAASSGCIRMRNIDVVDLHNRVKEGAKVIVQ